MREKNSTTVYSTDPNWRPEAQNERRQPQKQGVVYLRRETKGRGGKTVTIIDGLTGNLKQWKKELQRLCGSGGTVKGNVIEIQGDHRNKIFKYLETKGIRCKLAGG